MHALWLCCPASALLYGLRTDVEGELLLLIIDVIAAGSAAAVLGAMTAARFLLWLPGCWVMLCAS